MATQVDALLPLSFLEAVRVVDTPDTDVDAEFVAELRNKRLGLSDTVYAQIRRYTEASRRGQRLSQQDVVALARLIGRRPDADAVFRAAGRHFAQEAYQGVSGVSRGTVRILPRLLARPVALRVLRRIARRYFGGRVVRSGSAIVLDVASPVTLDAAPHEAGCSYYESALRELLKLLVGADGAVEHVSCASRGEAHCAWRTEWKRA
jgi:predicted hydrocarbon binding protein